MTSVFHSVNGIEISKEVNDDISFILTNKKGGYSYFGDKAVSKYHGMFYFNGLDMFRVIEDICLTDESSITEIENRFYCIKRKRGKERESSLTEGFFMPHGFDSLVYELSEKREIEVFLDIRHSYDSRNWGRFYEVESENECIVIRFTKKTDGREDYSDNTDEFTLYLAIKHDSGDFNNTGKWVEHYYALDKKRNSFPFTRYVYSALRLSPGKAVFSVSKSRKKAVSECNYVFKNSGILKSRQERYFNSIIGKIDFSPKNKVNNKVDNYNNEKLAYISAVNSLDSLLLDSGKSCFIQAGLPWFFQEWARDEMISLKALILIGKNKIASEIIERHFSKIKNGSTVTSEKNAKVNSSDAIGWMFMRLCNCDMRLKMPKQNIIKRLKAIADGLIESQTENKFAISNPQETWMDTLSRLGPRIEIQALRLFIYEMMFKLTKEDRYLRLLESLKGAVLENLWNGEFLFDGMNDSSVRPNVFIAYYAYPDLLSKEQWIKCFEKALSCLWLEWGGLSTIDKSDVQFSKEHTGQNPQSYHNGDSWFWLNNLAAIAMHRLDSEKFKRYISRILNSGSEEILFRGAVSHHSELSPAIALQSEGCPMQAWSSAMYIELIAEIFYWEK